MILVAVESLNSRQPAYHLEEVQRQLQDTMDVRLTVIINEKFASALQELRAFAGMQSSELQCPLMRLLQIEELLGRHMKRGVRPLSTGETETLADLMSGPSLGATAV